MASEGKLVRQLQRAVMSVVGSFDLIRRRNKSSWIAEV